MAAQPEIDWRTVVDQIRSGEAAGAETLYQHLATGARFFLRRRLGTDDVDDRVHDIFLIVVQAIQRGALREPERLVGFVRTILYRELNLEISRLVRARQTSATMESAAAVTAAEPTPEQAAEWNEKILVMQKLLGEVDERDFQILSRCYIREQSPEQIREEMNLTETQFNLLKSRAKGRLTKLLQQKMSRKRPT